MNGFNLGFDSAEIKEWLDSFHALIENKGLEYTKYLLRQLFREALANNCNLTAINTAYRNTICNSMDLTYPGNLQLESKILAAIRWNAIAMVVRANRFDGSLGGHLSTYASAAVLYEVGFNHFWHKDDLIFIQGHASPGIYARAFLEGRLSTEQLSNFRREIFGQGLASYPHPWSMPHFWQFSTVSMGLGPIQAIYQARFMRYLAARGLVDTANKKVWCFCGDGEMDEPESLGALSIAAREQLDNLIFVINCNLQRLDGPVRGNSKIIQELEAIFLGAGWNVIKVIWDSKWENLLAKDKTEKLLNLMENTVDGEYQCFTANGGKYLRENFFAQDPDLNKLIANLSDEELGKLEFGGHDFNKIYQAYRLATQHKGQPTVILAKTVKGYGLGAAGESLNTAHSVKKLNLDHLRAIQARFNLPLSEQQLENLEFIKFSEDSPELKYLLQQRNNLGGFLPARRISSDNNLVIREDLLSDYIKPNDNTRVISTTMYFVRILNTLCKDQTIGKYVVPIVADEARTFGMEGFFRQLSIYAPFGQVYKPVDSEQVMFYREAPNGQILQEGINEAGAFCSWLAAATAYSNHNCMLVPFYIYYSMFGFQRIGDLIWAAADMRARGFLIGATSGRTTLAGEGLQHGDGHSHVMASTIPNCISYDPTFGYELAVIIEDGLKRMLSLQQDVFYYITVMNENYSQLNYPSDIDFAVTKQGILKGLYLLTSDHTYELKVQLLGSGAILNEVIMAQQILRDKFKISANVWSATSFNLLAREARELKSKELFERSANIEKIDKQSANIEGNDNRQGSHLAKLFEGLEGPFIAATDYIKQYAEQIREFVPGQYIVLGTDGFSYSDTRENLRKLFKVSYRHIVIAALQALITEGKLSNQILDIDF